MRYARPAVYIERPDAMRPEPVVLRTDVAAFVGIARRGPLDTAVPVESFRQFAAHFGEFTGAGYLAYAVRGFFENGGRRCWIVRVANQDVAGGAHAAQVCVDDTAATYPPALCIAASSPGTWGNALSIEWALDSGPSALTVPAGTTSRHASVASVAGFETGTLVRIEQDALTAPVYRVVSATDVERGRIYWVHPEPGRGLQTDRELTGVDLQRPLRLSRVAYSMTVREGGRVRAVYRDLHLVPSHARYIAGVLAAPDYRLYWLAPARRDADLPRPAEPIVVTAADTDPSIVPLPLELSSGVELMLSGGTDGLLSLDADDFIGEPVAPNDSDFERRRKTRGLQATTNIEEIALVAMPDLLIRPDPDPSFASVPLPPRNPCVPCPVPRPVLQIHQPLPPGELPTPLRDADIARAQSALLQHCESLGDRFAVLSLPFDMANRPSYSREQVSAWRRLFDSCYGALYAPWLEVVDPRGQGTRRIPACGYVVGAIARTDLESGVQRAPGNVVLKGVTDLSREYDDADHGELNLTGINIMRGEFGRLPTLAGARTLSFDPAWRFINIMRLVMAIRKGAEIALRWVVFEPNDHGTRAIVVATLTELLQTFFERGAFSGATPQDSYFVRCDEVTTSREARDAGQLVALVGIAPAAPCEFIVLRVGWERNTISVTLYGEVEAVHA